MSSSSKRRKSIILFRMGTLVNLARRNRRENPFLRRVVTHTGRLIKTPVVTR
jgi:hypothetical protein